MSARLSRLRRLVRPVRRRVFPGSAGYWDRRYRRGGTSGPGSEGEHRRFKAGYLNSFVAQNGIETVVEFGCGDGNQLALSEYRKYVGLDVSPQAIAMCESLYRDDPSKEFRLYDPATFNPQPTADLTLSLDVILHLVEDDVFDLHLAHLFGTAREFVIVYGSDIEVKPSETAAHVRYRQFTSVIEEQFRSWRLEAVVAGLDPARADGPGTDFFVYRSD